MLPDIFVTDDGDSTTDSSQLHATWTLSDAESGIVEYQYAIGVIQGGTDAVGWTSVGTDIYVTNTDLKLTPRETYYFSVKAKNEAGLWSSEGYSDGITYLGTNNEQIVLDFFTGWNMISIPGDPAITDVSTLVNGTPVQPYAFIWDPDTGLEQRDVLESGTSYLFASTADTQITIEYQPRYNITCPVKYGWNMFGSVSCSVPVGNLTSDPADAIVRDDNQIPIVFRWDPVAGTSVQAEFIESGHGYMIPATAAGTLTVEYGGVPAPPATQTLADMTVTKPSWEAVIGIHMQNQHQELTFGMHPTASVGFDKKLDRPLPPFPPNIEGSLKAGWEIKDTHFSMLSRSYVSDSSHASWELSVELPEFGELQWRDLPVSYRCLLWHDGQVTRMENERSIPLSAGKHELRLVLDTPEFLPQKTQLLANYPNPFNPETWIPYQLREDARVEIRIYASTGQRVRILSLGHKPAGFYTDRQKAAYWDGRNEVGEPVSSGVYFYSLHASGVSQTRKLAIIR